MRRLLHTALTTLRMPDAAPTTQAVAAWLHRVAVRAALAARKQSRGGVDLTSEPGFTPPSAEAAEELRMLEEEVERLPDRYRVPMVLCHLDGKTNAEAVVARMARIRRLDAVV